MNGKLYLCATPIGNLGDVSARCLEAFNNAELPRKIQGVLFSF